MTTIPIPPLASPGIELTFIGICTHLWADQPNAPQNPAWGTRVVIVNASHVVRIEEINLRYGFNPGIRPHLATLSFVSTQVISTEGPKLFVPDLDGNIFTVLDGVTVTVANPTATTLVKDARCLPSLSSWMPDVAPGRAATSAEPEHAAGYFEFTAGTLTGTALTDRGDTGSLVYTVGTNGAPQIVITPFDSRSRPTTVTLSPDIVVQVEILNVPIDGDKDNSNDFVLHFLAAHQLPAEWPPATPALEAPCMRNPNGPQILTRHAHRMGDDFGPGCSNSNLP